MSAAAAEAASAAPAAAAGTGGSTWWPRVASLRPALLPQVSVHRQVIRGERWHVLSNEAAGVHHRVDDPAYQFIGRLNGSVSVQEAWQAASRAAGAAAPTQDEAIQLMLQLERRELLQIEHTPDTLPLFGAAASRPSARKRYSLNPFAFRLPLGDPARWLARLDAAGRIVFSRPALLVWGLLVVAAALAAGAHGSELVAQARELLPSPRMIALSWVLYPLIKALHETAHGMAVRRFGGTVTEFGLGLFMLVPAPYVDASAASRFASRGARMTVSAAGILVELSLAVAALSLWLTVQPGLVSDAAFAVMFICAVSTLVFNGNPLMRYDGYYLATDALELPNLASRSSQYWAWLLRRVVLRQRGLPPHCAPGERKWLLFYAPVSLTYRFVLWGSLILWLGGHWFLLGAAGFVYMLLVMVLRPLAGWLRPLFVAGHDAAAVARWRTMLALAAVVAGLLLFVLPLPLTTVAPAVVWLPEKAQVRPEVDGFIKALKVRDGQAVAAGDLLLSLDNPDLQTERDTLASRLEGQQSDRFQLLLHDPAAAQNLAEDIARTEAELARAEQRVAQLTVRAGEAGVLSLPHVADMAGQYVRRGEVVGYVLPGSGNSVQLRAAVDQDHAYLVRSRTHAVSVRLADDAGVGPALPAAMSGNVPAATRQLPSMALGDRAGGPYAVDPADNDGLRAVDPVVLVDVLVAPPAALEAGQRVGGRAWVRFDHGVEPLAFQFYRRATQLFLKQFNPDA